MTNLFENTSNVITLDDNGKPMYLSDLAKEILKNNPKTYKKWIENLNKDIHPEE
jgi:hypothetical protein